jgi:arginyl-tRNA synthetase
MKRYEDKFAQLLASAANIAEEEIRPLIRVPEPAQGDLSLPCFSFAKTLKKSPAAIASEIVAALPADPLFESVVQAGPYVNAKIEPGHLIRTVLPEICSAPEKFCTQDIGRGKTVAADYSSPNIAKPLGFHHLRSTMIGNALCRIHAALGYRVVSINFLGDWGKTFGLLAEAFSRWGDRAAIEKEGISYLLALYIRANKEASADPSFDEAARAMFRKQESGDPEALELWRLFREISLREFERVYQRLGVSFDLIEGESFYRDGMDEVIAQIAEKPGVRTDQGALVVDMPYAPEEPPMMLKKSDGATLYATRDAAAAMDRFERFHFDKCLYVVGVEQKRHFEQLKRALAAMGKEWSDRVIHVHFGRIQGMSTRKGTVVFLDEVLDEAKERAAEKMAETAEKRGMDLDATAEAVGIGGIVFGDLKNLRTSDYEFSWEEILNPKGFTGICVQYAHARCCSILKKGGGAPDADRADLSLLCAEEEIALVKEISRLPQAVVASAEALEPSKLARAVYEAARAWNRYQQAGNSDRNLRILAEDPALCSARLYLVNAVRVALEKGLSLLGLSAPEAM